MDVVLSCAIGSSASQLFWAKESEREGLFDVFDTMYPIYRSCSNMFVSPRLEWHLKLKIVFLTDFFSLPYLASRQSFQAPNVVV